MVSCYQGVLSHVATQRKGQCGCDKDNNLYSTVVNISNHRPPANNMSPTK